MLWEDSQEVADRLKLVNQMKSREEGMETETMGRIHVDNLSANILESSLMLTENPQSELQLQLTVEELHLSQEELQPRAA